MASNTRASPSSPLGSRCSMVRSTDSAANVRAALNSRYDDSGILERLVQVGRLAAHRTGGREDDLLHLHLGLRQLLLAVPLQQGAAFVGCDLLGQPDLSTLQVPYDALQ